MTKDEARKILRDLIDDQPSDETVELHAALAALSSPYGGREPLAVVEGWMSPTWLEQGCVDKFYIISSLNPGHAKPPFILVRFIILSQEEEAR